LFGLVESRQRSNSSKARIDSIQSWRRRRRGEDRQEVVARRAVVSEKRLLVAGIDVAMGGIYTYI
jgi:hypothetical protein